MSLLMVKLVVTPLMVLAASLAARRWGDAVGGWLVGLPLTSADLGAYCGVSRHRTWFRLRRRCSGRLDRWRRRPGGFFRRLYGVGIARAFGGDCGRDPRLCRGGRRRHRFRPAAGGAVSPRGRFTDAGPLPCPPAAGD